MNWLGLLYSNQGKLREAKEMYNWALEGKEKSLGRDHTLTLATVSNLGNLYRDQGKLKEAEAMYNQALEGFQSALGLTHPKSYIAMRNLELLQASRSMKPVKSWFYPLYTNLE